MPRLRHHAPRLASIVLVALLPLLAGAGTPLLELPLRCSPGRDCFIQNYFDHDPGPGWRDHACGRLAYDGHDGTDFRLLDRRQMQRGVAVVAAAAGTVVARRDGEPDIALHERATAPIPERAAGNGVRIDHGDGWETQYSHLRRGSVRVRVGDSVVAGQQLGEVGLSGRTDFPHLHLSVHHRGRRLDPFAPEASPRCATAAEAETRPMLWSVASRAALRYQPGGILGAGFAERSLTRSEIEAAEYAGTLTTAAAAIVFHVEAFGLRAGDVAESALTGPDGSLLTQRRETLERDLAVRRTWSGKRRTTTAWPPGIYRGSFRLLRGGTVVAEISRQIEVR